MKNNLIGILDQTYPGLNAYFDSPARSDGSQKWVDFAATYWHVDCVRKMSLYAFTCHYQKWCKRKKYNFSQSKAEEIYGKAKELVPVLPKDEITKLIIKHRRHRRPEIPKTTLPSRHLHRLAIRQKRHGKLDTRLEKKRLENRRQKTGQKRRFMERTRQPGSTTRSPLDLGKRPCRTP